MKITYDPNSDYPDTLDRESNPLELMNSHGCFACHTLNDNGGGSMGPVLDRDQLASRLAQRLRSQEYEQTVQSVDRLDEEPFSSFRDASRTVQTTEGLEQITEWLKYRIMEPRCDNPLAQMPNLGLLPEKAESVAFSLTGAIEEAEEPPSKSFFAGSLTR